MPTPDLIVLQVTRQEVAVDALQDHGVEEVQILEELKICPNHHQVGDVGFRVEQKVCLFCNCILHIIDSTH